MFCLESEEDEKRDQDHCPLCQNRGWHAIPPSGPENMEGLEGDELLMARAHRYGLWCEAVERGQARRLESLLQDDGSIGSDRRLLLAIGASSVEGMRACRHEDGKEDENSDDEGDDETDYGVSDNTSTVGVTSPQAINDLISTVRAREEASKRGRKRKATSEYSGTSATKKVRPCTESLADIERKGKNADQWATLEQLKKLRKTDAYQKMDSLEQAAAEMQCREDFMRTR